MKAVLFPIGPASRPAAISGWLALLCGLVLLCAQTLGHLHHTIHVPLASVKVHHAQHASQSHQMHQDGHGDSDSAEDDHDRSHDHAQNGAHSPEQHAQTQAFQAKPLAHHKPFFAQLLTRLFDHDSGSENCRLIDGAASAGMPNQAESAVFIAQAAIILIAKSQVTATARAAELFEARGPPSAPAALRVL